METNVFIYNYTDLLFEFNESRSYFDDILTKKWDLKMTTEKIFRYQLKILKERTISKKYLLQLNINRATHRRMPESFSSINEPFNHEKFNFNKIKEEEKISDILNATTKNYTNDSVDVDTVIINVSPLEYVHVMFIPFPKKCFPQVFTMNTLKRALEFSLLSRSRYFRIAFNSLGAHASVNHLHFHAYYLNHDMYLETAEVEKINNSYHKIKDYSAQGFVFQIRNVEELDDVIEKVCVVVDIIKKRKLSHNLYVTRGLDFESSALNNESEKRNCLRVYIWARKPSWGIKNLSVFNVAACELFGHIVVKRDDDYCTLTESDIANVLNDLTALPYNIVYNELLYIE